MPNESLASRLHELAAIYSESFFLTDPLLRANLIRTIEYVRPFNISFSDFHHSIDAQKSIGLRGKRILEIGGALSPKWCIDVLHAASWQAVEHHSYEDQVGDIYGQLANYKANNGRPNTAKASYTYCDQGINAFHQKYLAQSLLPFESAYSVACFEHIDKLDTALESVFDMLVPGARLYSYFSPIWSAPQELHCPPPSDFSPPPYFHLTHTRAEAYDLLVANSKAPKSVILDYIELLYTTPHINRLMPVDYLKILDESPFIVEEITFIAPVQPDQLPRHISEKINFYYPLCDLLASGIRLVLQKPLQV